MSDEQDLRARLNAQTARIPWSELAAHFARGTTIHVATDLDLVEVACQFAEDRAADISVLMSDQRVAAVNEALAAEWFAKDQQVWAVVVAPWVLVQPVTAH